MDKPTFQFRPVRLTDNVEESFFDAQKYYENHREDKRKSSNLVVWEKVGRRSYLEKLNNG